MATHVDLLFVQGAGENVHDRWDDKLVASLQNALGDGYRIRYPRMPNEGAPEYSAWKKALIEELASLGDRAALVAHSMGGTILLHALREERLMPNVRAVALIAVPFIGPGGWPSDELEPRADFSAAFPADTRVFLYHGTADDTVPSDHVLCYASAMPKAVVRILEGRDHQVDNDLGEVADDIRRVFETSRG